MTRSMSKYIYIFTMTLSAQPVLAGEDFFYNSVAPELAKNGCAMCHTQDYLTPRVFEYKELLPYLAMGDSPDNNVLISKMANVRPRYEEQASHPGGQRCGSIHDEPCHSIRQWWEIEFGEKLVGEYITERLLNE